MLPLNNKITTWRAMMRNLKIFKVLLSVLKRCIGVGVGVAGCMPTTKRFKLVHLFASHRSSEVPNKNKLMKNCYIARMFTNAKIVNLFISCSSPGLNILRRQAHLLNATCCFVSSPAAFEAKKKEQLLSCIFTSPDSQDSGKSTKFVNGNFICAKLLFCKMNIEEFFVIAIFLKLCENYEIFLLQTTSLLWLTFHGVKTNY
ncbi:hypothetical protein T10_1433 [Trichinella papuae]|uniref:Uncharacterized protein n=1 Tax=Trichinella papuae TaxID=268474 RepID=A0A0V1MNH8_9BILA|nr:hypothetical protein T10_1433 [Trichinella papuae]